jgi:RNA recognition motif-containing protein
MKKLFIGSLSFQTTDDVLADAFAKAGNVVSAIIIKDRMTQRSKGFGFVEMETEEMAQAAIIMWNGQELDGRRIAVNEARPLEKRF